MRHLTGPLARLTARPTDTEDYIWATLTDPTPLPDAMAQLRAAYQTPCGSTTCPKVRLRTRWT